MVYNKFQHSTLNKFEHEIFFLRNNHLYYRSGQILQTIKKNTQ